VDKVALEVWANVDEVHVCLGSCAPSAPGDQIIDDVLGAMWTRILI
jgi:hypothetical protein